MSTTRDDARRLLKSKGLRVTPPRLAVLALVMNAESPLSHSQVVARLDDTHWDPATIFRNLVKLRDAGLILVVNRANGIDRYALPLTEGDTHGHPHFVCEDCGQVSCLPDALMASTKAPDRWSASIQGAAIQLRGACPDCIDEAGVST